MANKEQLETIIEDGVDRWNAWRSDNPEVATDLSNIELAQRFFRLGNFQNTKLQGVNLEKADLQSAKLMGADLTDANLAEANLRDADLTGADLTGADLTGADLTGADLTGADLTGADLTNSNLVQANFTSARLKGCNLTKAHMENANLIDANLRRTVVDEATLTNARISENTLGLGRLGASQRVRMKLVSTERIPEDLWQRSDNQDSGQVNDLTVGYAKSFVGPAHWALQSLATPNDRNEFRRDLFVQLVGTVEELHQQLAAIEEENRRLADENENLRSSMDRALPLWKRAFEEFVLRLGGASENKPQEEQRSQRDSLPACFTTTCLQPAGHLASDLR